VKTEKGIGASPDEKIFTPTGERGFFPYTPHPTPSFPSGDKFIILLPVPEFPDH